MSSLDERIEELRRHLRIEAAVVKGAKNAITLLQGVKTDKKALSEVGSYCFSFCLSLVLYSLPGYYSQAHFMGQ
jgi:hypothetical protein